jgi:hypothetical protein
MIVPATDLGGVGVLKHGNIYMLSDAFENALTDNWSSSGAWIRNADYQQKTSSGLAAWVLDYADIGDGSASPQIPPNPQDRRLTTKSTFSIPSGRASYLRFEHADAFDWIGPNTVGAPIRYYDGGFVEVSVNGAAFKPLSITVNGYNHTIQATGTKGFGGDSTDWYTSRATMSSFAGKHVKFRFRLRTDGFASFSQSYGWWLDNVRLYSCRGPGAPGSVKVANMLGAKAKMTWRASTPNPGFTIASYVVKISGRPAVTLSASARRRVFRHLTIGHIYTFTIRAKNNRGASSVTVTRRLRIT